MFNLLVKGGGWDRRADSLPIDRVFEHTAPVLVERFKPQGVLATLLLRGLPTLFIPELGNGPDQNGYLGQIARFRASRTSVRFEYTLDAAPIPMEAIERLAPALDLDRFELNRTHWAVKDVDLLNVIASIASTSDTSELVRATTPERWRERALNLVEELAADCAASDDPEERAAGRLTMGAVEALRPYVAAELEPDRRPAWSAVFRALADFIPYGKRSLALAEAIRDLARAHGVQIL